MRSRSSRVSRQLSFLLHSSITSSRSLRNLGSEIKRAASLKIVFKSECSNAKASIAAKWQAASTARPSWLTEAALRTSAAARSGSPGKHMANASINICAPICSETLWPFIAADPLRGASIPCFRLRYAVCSVDRPRPPHQRIVLSSMI